MTTSFLTHPVRSRVSLLVGLLFLTFSSVVGQNTEYVGETVLTNAGTLTKNYHFTKSVTLRATGSGSTILSSAGGNFEIKSIATNPPPSPDKNFVRTEVPTVPVSSQKDLTLMDGNDKAVSYSYLDGLGRAIMSSSAEAGPLYEDVVKHYEYDNEGKQVKSFLPYAEAYTNPGAFIANAASETASFYNGGAPNVAVDSKHFSEMTYDPRGRVAEAIGVGEAWNNNNNTLDKKSTSQFLVHNPALTTLPEHDQVYHWEINGSGLPENDRYYAANELSVVVTKDVEERMSRVVTDMRGLVITSQVYDSTAAKWYGSYNVYDDFDRLAFVIPPMITSAFVDGTNTLNSTQMEELVFQYEYDERGRLKREKAPGAGWTEYIYDEWDRMVLSHYPGQQYEGVNSWTFYKYDVFNRQVITGELKTATKTRSDLETDLANQSLARSENVAAGTIGYTDHLTFPNLHATDYTDFEILTINYFDNYDFLGWSGWGGDYHFSSPSGFTGTHTTAVLDQATGSKVKIIDTDDFLSTVIYYDDRLRMLQTVGENHLGGIDRVTNELEWDGELKKMLLEHTSDPNIDVKVLSEYEYAHNGQLLKTWQTIDEPGNSGTRTLVADYKYNALGQVIEKNLHSTNGTSFLQSVDYDYNIKGWTSSINNTDLTGGDNDLFGMKFNYTTGATIDGSSVPGRHDGAISSMEWNTDNDPNQSGVQGSKTITGYRYDERNRLDDTKYGVGGGSWTTQGGYYDTDPEYDDNGNITSLTRRGEDTGGSTIVDNLDYTYLANSNKLKSVDDTSGNDKAFKDGSQMLTLYDYNQMGNATSDVNRQIQGISYNYMQYVDKITFTDGTKVVYTYDAAGNKLSKAVLSSSDEEIARVDYLGSIEYLDGEVNQVFTDEGRAYKQNDAYHYEYFLTDLQGNNRLAFGYLPERNVYLATMEETNSSGNPQEESIFTFPSNILRTVPNHTPLGQSSIALNRANDRVMGPAKVLTISQDDHVDLQVWARYSQSNGISSTPAAVVSSIMSTLGISTGDAGAGDAVSAAIGNGGAADVPMVSNPSNTQDAPDAYLQYLFFDTNYNYVSTYSGFERVTANSLNSFQKLEVDGGLTFGQDGFLFVYLVNETYEDQEVYFDDFKITHENGATSFKVSQVNEYYPFGLPSKTWRAPGYVDPGLLYQSSYAHYDSLTGYYDFLARSYDPAIGRFFAVDPAGQYSSPYVAMGNNPHAMVDPDGRFALGIKNPVKEFKRWHSMAASGQWSNFRSAYGDYAKQAGIAVASYYATAGIGSLFGGLGGGGSALGGSNGIGGSAVLHEGLRATAHGLAGVSINAAFGLDVNFGTFASGFVASGAGSFADGLSSNLLKIGIAGTSGGLVRRIGGGDFWAGFAQGVIVEGINHLMHNNDPVVKELKNGNRIVRGLDNELYELDSEGNVIEQISESTLSNIIEKENRMINYKGPSFWWIVKQRMRADKSDKYFRVLIDSVLGAKWPFPLPVPDPALYTNPSTNKVY